MITSSAPPRWRRGAGVLTAVAVGAGLAAVPLTSAAAAEGPAPSPVEYTVFDAVHADAVSTFYEEGRLVLDAKVDSPERGTRYDESDLWFHVNDHAKTALPAGASPYEFIAPGGTEIWMAPMTQNPAVIWPGFSTESVPAGTFDGDTTFTLVDLEGPGDVELFTNDSFGGIQERLWSSDEDASETDDDLRSFSRPSHGVHLHANWAFTEPGTYRFTVEASAQKDGETLSDTGVWTFVVGELPEDVATTTALTVSTTEAVAGDAVTLDATVTPAVDGYVEFLDGTTVLGHEPVAEGAASFTTDALGLGRRSLTARYVPAIENLSETSTSQAATVTVVEEGQDEVFGVYGLEDAYPAGDLIDLRWGGVELKDGETVRWVIRGSAADTSYVVSNPGPDGTARYVRDATTAIDGAQVAVQLRGTVDGKAATLQQSAWETLEVSGANVGAGEPVVIGGVAASYYAGDPVSMTVDSRPLADGETLRWMSRPVPYEQSWTTPWYEVTATGDGFVAPGDLFNSAEISVQLIGADGESVLGQSAAVDPEVLRREVQMSGLGAAYRAGDTATVAVDVYPAIDGLAYDWGFYANDFTWTSIAEGPAPSFEITEEMDEQTLQVNVSHAATGYWVGGASGTIRVTSAEPGTQEIYIAALSGHYHQGYDIDLKASAFPAASATDTYRWLWKRPDQAEFVPIAGATGASTTQIAEQALDGTLVKVEMYSAAGDLLATSDTTTIHHDDHGSKPHQKVSVAGVADHYHSGDEVELTASVEPASVLTRYAWYVQLADDDAPRLVEGEHASTLSFEAAAEFDGAAVFAQLTYDDGATYVESPPVTIVVDDHGHTPSPEPTDPAPSPEPTDPAPSPEPTDPAPSPEPTEPASSPEPTEPAPNPEPAPGEQPSIAPAMRTADDLGDAPEGGVEAPAAARAGEVVRIALGADHAHEWVAAWMFSTPVLLGGDWVQADAAGTVTVRIPADAPAGEHRLAVFAADGALLGWSAVSIAAAPTETGTIALPATGGDLSTAWLWVPVVLIGVGAAAVWFARRRRPLAD